MNIDLHCHAKVSKKSTFSEKNFLALQKSAIRNGLQAIALTEHFNTTGFPDIYASLERNFPYRNDCYVVNGLKVFCGMEVDVKEGGHIVLVGKRDHVLSLQQELVPHLVRGNFIPLQSLLEKATQREMLKIGAHPFRRGNAVGLLSGDLLKGLDALELNGKDFKTEEDVFRLAQSLGLPVTAGSDTHHWLQAGCVRNSLDEDCNTIEELKSCIRAGRYKTVVSPYISLQLNGAGIAKKILKKLSYA